MICSPLNLLFPMFCLLPWFAADLQLCHVQLSGGRSGMRRPGCGDDLGRIFPRRGTSGNRPADYRRQLGGARTRRGRRMDKETRARSRQRPGNRSLRGGSGRDRSGSCRPLGRDASGRGIEEQPDQEGAGAMARPEREGGARLDRKLIFVGWSKEGPAPPSKTLTHHRRERKRRLDFSSRPFEFN